MLITRRGVLKAATATAVTGAATAAWGIGYEPLSDPRIVRYRVSPSGWPAGLTLRIAVVSDIHTCEPWMSAARVREIIEGTNALKADLVVLLGDYVTHHRFSRRPVPHRDWAREIGRLTAPLGAHAVLGNHDWWEDREIQRRRGGITPCQQALEAEGLPVYHNGARRLAKDGRTFWIAGLGDQWAFYEQRRRRSHLPRFGFQGADDLAKTLGGIPAGEPVILLAHEPDIFAELPRSVSLTLSGHTHGGQVRLVGYAPVVPSVYGRRYVYGHIVEDGRHLVVSGGLGCSGIPVRMGAPPEIGLIEVGA